MSRASGTLCVGNHSGDIREREVEDLFCKGHKIEKSVNEVAGLVSGTESACCLVLNENKFPVSSFNGSSPESKEIIEHKDDNEKSLELQQSSENTDSLTPVADSGIVLRPVESVQNVLDSAREHEAEYKDSPSMKKVEDALDHTEEHGTGHVPPCLTRNYAAITKEVIEPEAENIEGAVSSSVSCSKLKRMTEDANDTATDGGDSTNCLIDKVITSMEFELGTPGPQSSESIDWLTLAADSSIVQRPHQCDENVLDIAGEHETEYKVSPIIKSETEDFDNVAVECTVDVLDLTTEHGTEHVPPCLTGNGVSIAKEIIEQETDVENSDGAVSTPVSCSKLKPITEDENDTSCLIDNVITSIECGLETPGPHSSESTDMLTCVADSSHSSESTDMLTCVADSSNVLRPVESDENVLDIAREHETEIIKSETGDADKVSIECVGDAFDLTTGNDASTATAKEFIEQETEAENFEGSVSSSVSCSKLKPITEDVNDTVIVGGDSRSCSIDNVITSMEFGFETPGPPHSSESSDGLTRVVDSSNVLRPVESDENVVDIAKEHETEYKASPSMENVASNTREIIKFKFETGDADKVSIECVEDSLNLTTEHGTEPMPSCLTGNDASTAKEVIEQETEAENFEGAVSSSVSCSKLKPITEDVSDTSGDNKSCLINNVINSMECGLETPGHSSESTDSLTCVADSSNVLGPVESVLDIARKHETEYKASPLMENIESNTHEKIKSEAGDADKVSIECVEDAFDLTTERGTEHVPSSLTGNDASTAKEVIEQETETENFEGAVSSSVNCSKWKPITEDVNDTAIVGGDSKSCSIDNVITSMKFGFEIPGPQSSESTDFLTSDENVLDIAREHETEYVPGHLTGNNAATAEEVIEQETEVENLGVFVSPSVSSSKLKPITEDVNDTAIAGGANTSCSTDEAITSTEFDLETPGAQDVSTLQGDDDHLKPEISTVNDVRFDVQSVPPGAEKEFEAGSCSVISSRRDMPCNDESSGNDISDSFYTTDKLPNCVVDKVDMESKGEDSAGADVDIDVQSVPSVAEKEFEVGSCSIISSRRDMPCNDVLSVSDSFDTKDKLPNCVVDNVDMESKSEHLAGAHVSNDDKLICQETKDVENSLKKGKSMSLTENSCADAVSVQVVESLTRPFHFLIRIPRFEDSKMKEQIRKAQLLVEEKTQYRDAFRIEVQKYKANCLGYATEYEAAVSESRTLKKSVRDKRKEIDDLQSVMNKVKNAISVDDIDTRIHGMEHMIEHETLPLKEEKLLIREIKQLKQLREQLSSNIGSHDELQQALNNRDQIEESLKVLKKELENLKDSVLKTDAVTRALQKKYEDENRKVKEVQTQYAAANNVRQDAYAQLQSLRRQLFEKNQQFRMYKDSAAAASDYAAKRDKEALHHLCVNQVESIMELWNRSNEFRQEYVRCNMKSTLRRLGTMDGRSLGPDEQPQVLAINGDERVDRFVSNPVKSVPILHTQNLEQDVVEPVEDATVDDKIMVKGSEQKIPATTGPRKQEKHVLRNDLATASGREITEDDIREEQHMPTEEELELARKVEELRRKEAEAKLKEQRRLEEKAKALEALERKKRNAEKAQMRAELRAQKEAEQREKEREKRLRKKEKRKGSANEIPDGNNLAETTPNCESLMETMKEPEIKENPVAVSKRPQKVSQFTKQSKAKSIPPPLRNRGRKKIQQWMWVIFTCLIVVALFFLGNVGFFSNLSSLRRRNSGF